MFMSNPSAEAIRKMANVDPKVREALAEIADAVPEKSQEIKQALEDHIKAKQAGGSWPVVQSIARAHHKDIGDAVMEAFESKPDAVKHPIRCPHRSVGPPA